MTETAIWLLYQFFSKHVEADDFDDLRPGLPRNILLDAMNHYMKGRPFETYQLMGWIRIHQREVYSRLACWDPRGLGLWIFKGTNIKE